MGMDMPTRLRTWREYRGLTLRQVSERSGVGIHKICRAETGRRDLFVRHLRAVVELGLRATMLEFWGPLPRVRGAKRTGRPRASSAPVQLTRARAA